MVDGVPAECRVIFGLSGWNWRAYALNPASPLRTCRGSHSNRSYSLENRVDAREAGKHKQAATNTFEADGVCIPRVSACRSLGR